MKNKIILFLIVLNLFNITSCNKRINDETSKTNTPNEQENDNYTEFLTKLSKYTVTVQISSDDKKNIYNEYIKDNNIIRAINTYYHPNFLRARSYLTKAKQFDNITLVNTNHYLSTDYEPKSLVKVSDVDYIKRDNVDMYINEDALREYKKLYNDALRHNIKLCIFSAYRSFDYQKKLYDSKEDKNYIALPGYSEHHTGNALDISVRDSGLSKYFDKNEAYSFLINNAYKYGFILRYLDNKQEITGYPFESWHYTYVGTYASNIIHDNNYTLEEYIFNHYII